MSPEALIQSLSIRPLKDGDASYLEAWIRYATDQCASAMGALSPDAVRNFGVWYADERGRGKSTAINAACRIRRLVGEPAGVDYRKANSGLSACACGEGIRSSGRVMCSACRAASASLAHRNTIEARRARKLRSAVGGAGARAVGEALGLTAREVFLRFVGREPTSDAQAAACIEVLRMSALPPLDAPRLEDHLWVSWEAA